MIRRAVVGALLLLASGFYLAVPAFAHATFLFADPADGSRLTKAPAKVTLAFSEDVGLGSVGYVRVTDQSGTRVDSRDAYHPSGAGQRVANDLRAGPPDGTFTVSFRVVSADGHPIAGVVRFVVGDGPLLAPSVGSAATTDRGTSIAFDLTRGVSYGGLALLGGAWLALTVWPAGRMSRRARWLVAGGWVASVVGAIGGLLAQGPYTAGTGLSTFFDWSLIQDTLQTNYGHMMSARLVLLGVLAPVLARAFEGAADSPLEILVWPFGAGLAITFAAAGHAESTSPRRLSVLLDGAHVVAMMAWLGGLVMLLVAVLPRRDEEEMSYVLPVFSRVALGSVAVLAGTGTFAAWKGVGSWDAVLNTSYGLLVSTKVMIFLGLIALGYVSRKVVLRFAASRVERLRRAVFIEVLLGATVLGFTAVLVAQPRGNEALAAGYRQPVSGTAPFSSRASIDVGLDRGVHGLVSVTMSLPAAADAKAVSATATQAAAKIGPVPLDLKRAGPRLYSANNVNLPVAGKWRFDLVVTTSSSTAVTTDVTITLH